jgi:ankyrin repeat protein
MCTEQEKNKILKNAIYHSPISFIRALLEIGADPNPEDHSGFAPLIAALTCSQSQPGSPGRPDVLEILQLLLSFGADTDQRGLNDYTPLHMAIAVRNLEALNLLLAMGANPHLKTRIDDYETPREMAVSAGLSEFAELLAEYESRQ